MADESKARNPEEQLLALAMRVLGPLDGPAWVDRPNARLGGVTPRAAVRAGRVIDVAAELNYLDSQIDLG